MFRASLLRDFFSWCNKNFTAIVILVIVSRILLALVYDYVCFKTNTEFIVPDGHWYVAKSLVLSEQDFKVEEHLTFLNKAVVDIYIDNWLYGNWCLTELRPYPIRKDPITQFYSLVNYRTYVFRLVNLFLSILSVLLVGDILRRRINTITAKLFIVLGLSLPTQVLYGASIGVDILTMFVLTVTIWIISL